MPKMKKRILKSTIAVLILLSVLAGQTIASAVRAQQQTDLIAEYSKHMGFAEKQVLDVYIAESIMKVSINECSFCGVLKNDKKRSDLAHKTLNWFLDKTGQKEGTVEWYNKSKTRIMTISGNETRAKITSGPSCAINKNK
jgi:hypothetical protein